MRQKVASGDQKLAEIAALQHGVVSTRQLLACGITPSGISRRVRAGRLHRVHRGVYAVGHVGLPMPGRWMAAVLACGRNRGDVNVRGNGPSIDFQLRQEDAGATWTVLDFWGAAISHRTAAVYWGLLPVTDCPIDISVPGDGGKLRRRGLRLHRCLSLLHADVTFHGGIPVTTPARTVADLRQAASRPGKRGSISPQELRRAIRQADVRGLPLGDDLARDRTRSDLERDFLRLCRQRRLPAPEVNVRVGPHLVDFLWPDAMLIVETDGYVYHRGRTAFEDDRARDLDLRARGFEVIRLAGRQVTEEADRVAEVLLVAIGNRTQRGHSDGRRDAAP